ncbi:MAG TPA: hypothetical protein VH041_05930 [Caldimonas sp.]|jgi:hypothetical protein|nr:hypothetical protein [Caldimonas sp.]HEX4233827.1 hypothetical protein [Caldimonas sp.]
MRIWLALIVAPLLALADQSIAFALVGWACAHQSTALVHASHLVFLLLTAGAAVYAWQGWREAASANGGAAAGEMHFLSGVATATASLSAIAIVAMWVPTWMISSCIA